MDQYNYLHQQAWNYFALHAQQRLTTVNFYLVVATTLTAAAVASFDKDFGSPWLRFAAGLLLSLLSFAFWRLDFRNRELIKAAENALRSFESEDKVSRGEREVPVEWLFTREHQQSERRRASTSWIGCLVLHSYSHVLNVLFGSFLFGGALIAVLAIK